MSERDRNRGKERWKQEKRKRKKRRKNRQQLEKQQNVSRRKKREVAAWERLDNTANLFPAIATQNMTNVYRISVTLSDHVERDLLQQALDEVLPVFDTFRVRMRKGLFWNYFETNYKAPPLVELEDKYPCSYIEPYENNGYLFRVSYYRNRINLEVFHVLADGMGAVNFLRELTYCYLRLAHPETDFGGQKGEHLPTGELGVIHGSMSLSAVKQVCHQRDVSINEYMTAVFIYSIYKEYLKESPSSRPIAVAVPVNLRPYFESVTTRNFFVMVSAVYAADRTGESFDRILELVTMSLREQITKEHLEELFSYNVSNQKNIFLRSVPMFIKVLAMRFVYRSSARANTSTLTNIGAFQVQKEYESFIEKFHGMIAMSTGQHIKALLCSYRDELVLNFSSTLRDVSIQRRFFRKLVEDGIEVTIESNGVYYE